MVLSKVYNHMKPGVFVRYFYGMIILSVHWTCWKHVTHVQTWTSHRAVYQSCTRSIFYWIVVNVAGVLLFFSLFLCTFFVLWPLFTFYYCTISDIWYSWIIHRWSRHPVRALSLNTVTTRHYSASQQSYIWLKQLPIMSQEGRSIHSGIGTNTLRPHLSTDWFVNIDARGSSAELITWYNSPSTNDSSPSWYLPSHEPRGPSSSSLAPSTVTAPVCRSYRKHIVDIAGTWSTMTCCFRTERWLSPGHHDGHQGKVGRRYRILVQATDAARRLGLNVVLWGGTLSTPVQKWNSSDCKTICG